MVNRQENHSLNDQLVGIKELVPVAGIWTPQNGILTEFKRAESKTFSIGVNLGNVRAATGEFSITARITDTKHGCAGIVFGYNAEERSGFFAGIGGWDAAYALGRFFLESKAVSLFMMGSSENIQAEHDYQIRVALQGVQVSLSIYGVEVFSHSLPAPPSGDQIGLYAYGDKPVQFTSFDAKSARPRAFVVMQFSEPYNSLWKEVIQKVADGEGFDVHRGDDVYHPGIILQDIVKAIRASDVVIAEVTPKNPNVYYELGYAHAIGVPTILLAERGELESLPFDVSGYRCIFYEDAIRGKSKVEEDLRKHLRHIKESRGVLQP